MMMWCVEVEEALVLSTWEWQDYLDLLVEDVCYAGSGWSVYESRFWH